MNAVYGYTDLDKRITADNEDAWFSEKVLCLGASGRPPCHVYACTQAQH